MSDCIVYEFRLCMIVASVVGCATHTLTAHGPLPFLAPILQQLAAVDHIVERMAQRREHRFN